MTDDLGHEELGCYGNIFNETPNLDQLAKEGMTELKLKLNAWRKEVNAEVPIISKKDE